MRKLFLLIALLSTQVFGAHQVVADDCINTLVPLFKPYGHESMAVLECNNPTVRYEMETYVNCFTQLQSIVKDFFRLTTVCVGQEGARVAPQEYGACVKFMQENISSESDLKSASYLCGTNITVRKDPKSLITCLSTEVNKIGQPIDVFGCDGKLDPAMLFLEKMLAQKRASAASLESLKVACSDFKKLHDEALKMSSRAQEKFKKAQTLFKTVRNNSDFKKAQLADIDAAADRGKVSQLLDKARKAAVTCSAGKNVSEDDRKNVSAEPTNSSAGATKDKPVVPVR